MNNGGTFNPGGASTTGVVTVRKEDVLCGRGNLAKQPGNRTFLSIVSKRKDEYKATNDSDVKKQIAADVLNAFMQTSDPPPRFLMPVGGIHSAATTAQRSGGNGSAYTSGEGLWRELGQDEITNKVRMALRQKPKVRKPRSNGSLRPEQTTASGQKEKAMIDEHASPMPSSEIKNSAAVGSTEQAYDELMAETDIFLSETDLVDDLEQLFHSESSLSGIVDPISISGIADNYYEPRPLGGKGDGSSDTSSAPRLSPLLGSAAISDLVDDLEQLFNSESSLGGIVDPISISGTADNNHEPRPLGGKGDGSSDTSSAPRLSPLLGSAASGIATASAESDTPVDRDCRQGKVIATLHAARVILRNNLKSLQTETTPDDIESFGRVLYCMLTGISLPQRSHTITNTEDNGESCPNERSAKRTHSGHSSSPSLLDLGFPVNVHILISDLLDATDSTSTSRFTSMEQILDEINCLLDNPKQLLFAPAVRSGQLVFPEGQLYGRNTQQSALLEAFQAVAVTREEDRGLALISGISGSGKTSLVEILIAPLIQRQGMLIPIKFDQQGREPMTVIFQAFDTYLQNIQHISPEYVAEITGAINSTLGPLIPLLASQIPSLLDLIGDVSPGAMVNLEKKDIYNLILYSLQNLVRAIAAPNRPLAIMFDDLQWADKESMRLITKLVTDVDTRYCLFIGCYRENEITEDHPLFEGLGRISVTGTRTWNISLDNLSREDVRDLLRNSLLLTPRICNPLADALVKKTGGNPLFVKNLILSLSEEGLLQYSASARRWDWDLDAILSKAVPDTAVGLLLDKMRRYGADVQWTLRLASLLGAQFDVKEISLIQQGLLAESGATECSDIASFVNQLLDDGLVMKVGNASSDSLYRFSHDQIWQAAISLTEVADVQQMHLLMGRQLLIGAQLSGAELDRHILPIVDQMNQGVALITDYDEKVEIAKLNLRAGELSLAASSFLSASIYLLQGSVLVSEESDWINNYDLCLRLFTGAAEVQLILDNYDGAIISVQPVLKHGKDLDDKLRAYEALSTALFSKGKNKEAQQLCIAILDELGSPMPSFDNSIIESKVIEEFQRAESMIADLSIKDILETSDAARQGSKEEIATMRILNHLAKASYSADDTMGTILSASRMIQNSLLRGITAEMSFAFSAFALVLCHLGKHSLASLCGEVAQALVKKYHGKHSTIVVSALAMSTYVFRQPLQALIPICKEAYASGMAVGENDWACALLRYTIIIIIFAPERKESDLDQVEAFIRKHLMLAHIFVAGSLPYFQAVLNLRQEHSVEHDSDPTVLTGEACDVDDLNARWEERGLYKMTRRVFFCKLWMAYLFRRYDKAAIAGDKIVAFRDQKGFYPSFEYVLETLYLSLIGFALVRNGKDEDGKWRNLAAQCCASMLTWAQEDSKWNFQHKSDLLMAEQAYTSGDHDEAAARYTSSIKGAGAHGFVNEQALACERAGLFYLDQGNITEAKRHLQKAELYYGNWGARRKVRDMQRLLENVC